MADLSSDEFASWLRPRDALSKLNAGEDAAAKKLIVTCILNGRVRIAGQRLSHAGSKPDGIPRPSLVDAEYLCGPWVPEWGEFWSSGLMAFVRHSIAPQGFAVSTVIGVPGFHDQPEIHIFHGVRLDPVAMRHEFDLDLLPDTTVPPKKPARQGDSGRPSGKHGEPIARITKRLLAMSVGEIRSYTAEALSIELREEYRRLGLNPSAEDNARRDAAGILRVVRE